MQLQQHSAMKALGEIGLDYEWAKHPTEQQRQWELLEYLCLYCHSDSCPILLHTVGIPRVKTRPTWTPLASFTTMCPQYLDLPTLLQLQLEGVFPVEPGLP